VIALDTSALIRYLLSDGSAMAGRVEQAVAGREAVGVSTLVLLEVVHVLRGEPYRGSNPALADAIIDLVGHRNVVLTDLDADLAAAAISAVRHLSPRHIADALISAAARQAGARQLLTADRTFASQLVPVVQLGD
jgi:predicted nucleic acid-binding protein